MGRRDEISAGLLAYRRRDGVEVLLAHPGGPFWARKDDGAWAIPKGLVRPDDLLTGARREFNEETGLVAEGTFAPLKPVRQKSGKTVHGFAFEADFSLDGFVSNTFEMEWPPRSGKKKGISRDRPDRLVRHGRGDGEDHRLSAAVPGGVAEMAAGRGWRGLKGRAVAAIRLTCSPTSPRKAGRGKRLRPHLLFVKTCAPARTSCRWNEM